MIKRTKHDLNLYSLCFLTAVGFGASGQVILLKDSNIGVNHCDYYINRDGFKVLKIDVSVYENLSTLFLEFVPRDDGNYCELYEQTLSLWTLGEHCGWIRNSESNNK
jgi:hypothetical protein